MLLIAGLFFLGLCFGSFVNALVWRTRQQEIEEQEAKDKKQTNLSILTGRSQCIHCGHELAAKDLVPVFSWLLLRGRCRYCGRAISVQYPIVELAGALVFVLSYKLWPSELAGGEWLLLATWLASSVGLLALAAFDLKWMLLPNRILYPTLAVAFVGRLGYVLFFSADKAHNILLWVSSIAVSAGIFGLIYYVSKGRWIGFGDVRLGFVTGTLLASPALSFVMIFLASVLGVLFILPALMSGRRDLSAKLPFGPFLIAATVICVLFGQRLLDWYQSLLT